MKKNLLLLVLSQIVSTQVMAQGWLNRAIDGYRERARAQRVEQQAAQRNNNQQTYRDRQRFEQQEHANQQSRDNRQREYVGQQGNRVSSADEVSNRMSEQPMQSQTNEKVISLVANGTGSTEEEAIKNALRSAIEQVYGSFISANTHIVNDELIKDEIVSVTSGNIENYSLISSDYSSDGKVIVIVKATVSIGKLVQYAQSKGASVELAGATFAMNMKIREMETNNEYQALLMLKKQMCLIASKGIYDYNVTIEDPSLKPEQYPGNMSDSQRQQYLKSYKLPVKIDFIPNNNAEELIDCIIKTLKGISIPLSEVESYKKAGLPVYRVGTNVYLRNDFFSSNSKRLMPFQLLRLIKTLAACSFKLTDNIGNSLSPIMDYAPQWDDHSWRGYKIAKEYNYTFYIRDEHLPEILSTDSGKFRNNHNTESGQYWYHPFDLNNAKFHIYFIFHYTEKELSNLSKINVVYDETLMDSFMNKLENDGFRLSD